MKDRTKRLIRNTSDENNRKLAEESDNGDVAREAEQELAEREEHDRRREENNG